VHGELLVLGIEVAASTVWEILHEAGIDPAPDRSSITWPDPTPAGSSSTWTGGAKPG
jgi:transposase